MFVTEHLDKATRPLFSYEIIPPPRGRSAREILETVEQLLPFEPPFIDVTAHSASATYEVQDDSTLVRRVRRKRPGTVSLCGIIQNRYNIDTVPHLLCRGFTREETEDAMIELNFLGIHNTLAIRGDEINYKKHIAENRSVNEYADSLVKQLHNLRQGVYLEELEESEPMEMCIGVAAYPEKHYESPNLKTDIKNLKKKVEAGADYIVTQMFFDNKRFFEFVERCRNEGISVPIIPGLKILNNSRQLTSIPRNFHVDMPDELVDEIQRSPRHVRHIGVQWALRQCRELLEHDVKCIHFFVLSDVRSVVKVVSQL